MAKIHAQEPLLGPRQNFPQHCSNCGDRFECGRPVVMKPVIHEGERLCVGRLPELSGLGKNGESLGRVLWYDWQCEPCAYSDGEPIEVTTERLDAEHRLNLSSSMMARRQREQRSRGSW